MGLGYRDRMFLRRKQVVVQNDIVARRMKKFFRTLKDEHRAEPEAVAVTYAKHLWNSTGMCLVDDKRLSRSRFYVGLSTDDNFDEIVKRSVLISDTLLLSHHSMGAYHELGVKEAPITQLPKLIVPSPEAWQSDYSTDILIQNEKEYDAARRKREAEKLSWGMNCFNLAELGRWILDAEPLLKAGLAWYLPSYAQLWFEQDEWGPDRQRTNQIGPIQTRAIDYLVKDGRAVDGSGAEPIKSQLVRPVLRMELPFIEGVSLREFSKITIEEFAAYSAFRDSLRQSLLDMDESLNAVQSDRELLRLSLQIKDQIRSVRSEMETVRRKRAVGVTGAVIGSVGAILVAVYGPALEAAIAALGATGGVWGIIHAATENSTRALREDKWYYVWALAKESNTHVL